MKIKPVNFVCGHLKGMFNIPFTIQGLDTLFDFYLNFGGWSKEMPKPCNSQNAFWYLYRRFGVSTSSFDNDKSIARYSFYPENDPTIVIDIIVRAMDIHIGFFVSKELNKKIHAEFSVYINELMQEISAYSLNKYGKAVLPMSFYGVYNAYKAKRVQPKDGNVQNSYYSREFTDKANYEIICKMFEVYCEGKQIAPVDSEVFWGDEFNDYCFEQFEKVANEVYPSFIKTKIGFSREYLETREVYGDTYKHLCQELYEKNKKNALVFVNYFEANQEKYPTIYKTLNTAYSFEAFMQKPVNVRDVYFDLWGVVENIDSTNDEE